MPHAFSLRLTAVEVELLSHAFQLDSDRIIR